MYKIMKHYRQAPLPFVGQKRNFIPLFKQALANIPNDGAGWTIIDVFGGSGLLAHVAKRNKPAARVIYNDYDHYVDRLQHIPDYNRLRMQLAEIIGQRGDDELSPEQSERVKAAIKNFDGHIDLSILSSWLMFSTAQTASLDDFLSCKLYNRLRRSPIPEADGYLDGLEIVHQDFAELMTKFKGQPNTLMVLDPPYVSTMQGAYANERYFGMVPFLKLMNLVTQPFILFSSTRSEVLDYLDYLKTHNPQTCRRFDGYTVQSLNAKIARGITYQDNMVVKF